MFIKFDRITNFTGRNGYFKCSGVDVLDLPHNNTVMLAPLTSRDDIGKCDIEIPKESIPALIELLNTVIQDGTLSNQLEGVSSGNP